MSKDKQNTFPLLVLTLAENIDYQGNLKKPLQFQKVDLPPFMVEPKENTPAIMGFLLALSLMASFLVSYFFFILSFFILILILGMANPPKSLTEKNAPQKPDKNLYLYALLAQKIVFERDTISIQANFLEGKKIFLHTDIKEINLHFEGIAPIKAHKATHIYIIKMGRKYDYHFWVDSEESKQALITILEYLYEKKVPMKEYSHGEKSYLLQNEAAKPLEIPPKIQSLINEIGEKEEKNEDNLL